VNFFPFDVPAGVVTVTGPVVAPAGAAQVITVSDHADTVACTPLKETVEAPWEGPKNLPLTITVAPTFPEEGDKEVMAGGFTVKVFPFDVPVDVVTVTGPVVAPAGTAQPMAVSDQEEMTGDNPLK